MSSESFVRELGAAEDRLRSFGFSGRAAFAALCRHLAARLDLPRQLWLEGPDAPAQAALERIPLTAELDLFGLAYERFFPEVFKAEHGQFFTPRPLVELMVDLAGLRPGQRVLDPTCGSGSFLVAAAARGGDVDGLEVDPELVALCRLNLKLHGIDPRSVRRADLFRDPLPFDADERWDLVLANPPFSVEVGDPTALLRSGLAQGREQVQSDELVLEAAWRLLRPGGRLCTLVPQSLVGNARTARIRDWLGARFLRRAVVALPEGVFRPFGGTGARACVLCLEKRPARLRPWAHAVVEHPGYDPGRRSYRATEPDDFGALRIAWREGLWPERPADDPGWDPLSLRGGSGIASGVPTVRLVQLAPYTPRILRPGDEPHAAFTEVDLADVDKQTGEVAAARERPGVDLPGTKVGFEEGDLLFARIRPALNNVALARRPDPALPPRMCGSGEWLRLVPRSSPHFVLVAARSPFVRAQLQATGGHTRPRIRVGDLEPVQVPDPGPEARARIEALVGQAQSARRAARQVLDQVDTLYAAFGRGELDAAQLLAQLQALSAPGGLQPG